MKRIKPLTFISIAVIALLLFDNLIALNHFSLKTVSFQYGTNCDITNGAISNLKDKSYVFVLPDNDTIINSNGNDKVLLKARGKINYGFASFIPFYKPIEPTLTFDCYIENSNKYIGKIEINKKITMTGLFTRKNMKSYVISDYLNEATKILNNKSIAYSEFMIEQPFQDPGHAESPNDIARSKIMVCLSAPFYGFKRNIPIRQKEEVYADTIFFTNAKTKMDYPFYETYAVDKPQKKLTYSSIDINKKVLFSKTFDLEKVQEDKSVFHYYTTQVLN